MRNLTQKPFTISSIEESERHSTYLTGPLPTAFYFRYAFLMEGEVLLEVNDQRILLTPGQFILIPEGQSILIHYFKDCKGFNGHFYLNFLKDASYPVLRSSKPFIQSFWFDDAVFIGALFKRIQTAYDDRDKTFIQNGLDMVLGQLRADSHMAQIPEKFLHLVFDRDRTPRSVSDYAQELNVTANYLNKTVKQHTNRTAIDWIEIARLNLAKQLLKRPEVSIHEIAIRTGLDDQSYFSRFFKKKTGLTPSQFRNGE